MPAVPSMLQISQRLLAAPLVCLILGILVTPKFLVLAVVYALTAVKPLYGCYCLQCVDGKAVDAALSLHRSLTIQFSMLAICLFLYEHSRLLVSPGNTSDEEDGSHGVVHDAFDMARRLVRWEHAVHLDIEPQLQHFVLNHCHWVISVANAYYAVLHFVAPFAVMARLVVFQQDTYFQHRLAFFVMLVLALVLFALLPTMPPRLMKRYQVEYIQPGTVLLSDHDATILKPYWDIVDTMAQGETLYDKLHKEGGNPYAAMPSMHTGWALWSCLTLLDTMNDSSGGSSRRRTILTILSVAHVVCMVLVILITGNHFWMDSVAGAACVVFGRVLSRLFVERVVLPRCGTADARNKPAGGFSLLPMTVRDYDEGQEEEEAAESFLTMSTLQTSTSSHSAVTGSSMRRSASSTSSSATGPVMAVV